MNVHPQVAALVLSACLATLQTQAGEPSSQSLAHGLFKPPSAPAPKKRTRRPAPALHHPLPPTQKLAFIRDRRTLWITGGEAGDGAVFPILAAPASEEPGSLAATDEEEAATFLAPLDLTGSGVSDLIYTRPGLQGWRVLSNGARFPRPVQAFVAGFYEKDSESLQSDLIPADTRELKQDQDLLAAVGDFLGNGTEQLAYTRPGRNLIWIVGTHGAMTMKADLTGIQATPQGPRVHWLFPFRTARKGQRTRLAYYRLGSDQLLRLTPKGMAFKQDLIPLKGNWERLQQAALDWPQAPLSEPPDRTAASPLPGTVPSDATATEEEGQPDT